MGYPQTSNFTASQYGSAWWVAEQAAQNRVVVVESVGRAVLAQMQNVLYAGVRPGTRGFDRTLSRRIKVDGIVGPETLNALWAYARQANATQAMLAPIEADIRNRRFSDVTAIIGIWYTYHQPRWVDLDEGPAGARRRVQRSDPAIAFEVSSNNIRLPGGTVLPAFLEAPNVPEADTQLLRVNPTIVPLDADGNAQRDQARVVSSDGSDARTQTPATSDVTFTPATTTTPAPSTPPAPTTLPTTAGGPGATAAGTPGPTTNTTNNTSNKSTGIRPLQIVFGAAIVAGIYALATDRR